MLAENIKAARQLAGLTQQELADRIGVPRSKLTGWETRRYQPDVTNFMRLCRALGVSPESLSGMELEDALADLSRPVAELARKLAAMPPQTFAIIQRVILSLDEELNGSSEK